MASGTARETSLSTVAIRSASAVRACRAAASRCCSAAARSAAAEQGRGGTRGNSSSGWRDKHGRLRRRRCSSDGHGRQRYLRAVPEAMEPLAALMGGERGSVITEEKRGRTSMRVKNARYVALAMAGTRRYSYLAAQEPGGMGPGPCVSAVSPRSEGPSGSGTYMAAGGTIPTSSPS